MAKCNPITRMALNALISSTKSASLIPELHQMLAYPVSANATLLLGWREMISYKAFLNATLLLEWYEMQLYQANATLMLETKNGIKRWHIVVWQMQP